MCLVLQGINATDGAKGSSGPPGTSGEQVKGHLGMGKGSWRLGVRGLISW